MYTIFRTYHSQRKQNYQQFYSIWTRGIFTHFLRLVSYSTPHSTPQLPASFPKTHFLSHPPSATAYLYNTLSASFKSATSSIQHFHHTKHRTPLRSNTGCQHKGPERYCMCPNRYVIPFGLCSHLSSFIAQNKKQIIIPITNIFA